MGEVHRARDTRLDREVAIKAIPPALAAQESFRQRFLREAKAISSLNHPNICTLYDVGEVPAGEGGPSGTHHYLVMEMIEGESLADRLARGPLPLHEVLKYGRQIASARIPPRPTSIQWFDFGGRELRWRADGRELVYAALDGHLVSVAIQTDPVFRPGSPARLFALPEPPDTMTPIFEDMTADARRFLLNAPTTSRASIVFHAILDWPALLEVGAD
jgi:hypothetical protein